VKKLMNAILAAEVAEVAEVAEAAKSGSAHMPLNVTT